MFTLELSTLEDSHKQSACYKYNIIKTYHNIPLCQIFIYEHGYSLRFGEIFCVSTSCIVVLIELSHFMPIILICISIPIKSFQAFKNQTLPVSFSSRFGNSHVVYTAIKQQNSTRVFVFMADMTQTQGQNTQNCRDRWAKHKVSQVYVCTCSGYFKTH